MWNKFERSKSLSQFNGENTQILKKLLKVRDQIKQEIWPGPWNGCSNLWFDNWTILGPLTHIASTDFIIDQIDYFIEEGVVEY